MDKGWTNVGQNLDICPKFVKILSDHTFYRSTGNGVENRASSPTTCFFIHRGRMIPSELERLVERDSADGKTPFFVNATAGTTVTGSYDPIGAVADVAEKHGMWLHVDVS